MGTSDTFQLPIPDGHDPLHERLAAAIERWISSGQLRPGERLPTHRELSRGAGVAIGTVTKAISYLEKRGVVRSETGRGTFVNMVVEPATEFIDLNFNIPLPVVDEGQFRAAAVQASSRLNNTPNGGYPEPGGHREHRKILSDWLSATRLELAADDMVVTVGGQHAIHLAMADLAGHTRGIATEAATFSGAIAAANNLGLQLHAVDHDEEGMLPDALERLFAESECRAIYLTPVCQNPYGFEMTEARRKDILAVCRRADAFIIEDDLYGIYSDTGSPTFRELDGERVYYINGLSKSLTPLVRVGVLAPPQPRRGAIASRIRAELWGVSAFDLEVAKALFEMEAHLAAREALRAEARSRVELAASIFHLRIPMPSGSPHVWLPMPKIAAQKLARQALEQGVRITPPDAVAVGGEKAGGVRLCLMAAPQRDSLTNALRVIANLRAAAGFESVASDLQIV